MVVRRTIRHMRQRPHEERRAFAVTLAIGVVMVLFIGWAIAFVASLGSANSPLSNTASSTASLFPESQSAASDSFDQ